MNFSMENDNRKTFSGKTLLLVDDDAVMHDLVKEFVKEESYRLLHLFDGTETVKTAKEKKPDLILLDVMMPFSDGRDVCRKLKDDPETKDIPVIMVTAKDDHYDRLVCLDMGVEEYIAKPCSRMYMMSTIKKVLKKKGK